MLPSLLKTAESIGAVLTDGGRSRFGQPLNERRRSSTELVLSRLPGGTVVCKTYLNRGRSLLH
jgi:hypothetical protein